MIKEVYFLIKGSRNPASRIDSNSLELDGHQLVPARGRKGEVVLDGARALLIIPAGVHVAILGAMRGETEASRGREVGVLLHKSVDPQLIVDLVLGIQILLHDRVGGHLECDWLDVGIRGGTHPRYRRQRSIGPRSRPPGVG